MSPKTQNMWVILWKKGVYFCNRGDICLEKRYNLYKSGLGGGRNETRKPSPKKKNVHLDLNRVTQEQSSNNQTGIQDASYVVPIGKTPS